MKNFLAAAVMLTSMSAFAQSYLILNNGVTLTTDKAGFVFDFGHFRVPYKLTGKGGQFIIEEKKLSTVDAAGFLFEKKFEVDEVKGKGLNFFIDGDDHLVTIDAKGFYYEYDKDDDIFEKAVKFGGNFFLVKPAKSKPEVHLYTVNDKGNYFKLDVAGLNPADITATGGTYFQTKNGVTFTVSKDGFVYPKKEVAVGTIVKAGGNFLIDSTNKIYTVTEEGFLMLPVLPANIVVADIQKIGANYLIDSVGRIFVVDKAGKIFERAVEHDLRNVKVLSL